MMQSIFTYSKKPFYNNKHNATSASASSSSEPQKTQQSQFIPRPFVRRSPAVSTQASAEQPPLTTGSSEPKPLWGSRTWFFFHTLAHKIKPEEFDSTKKDLFYFIQQICSNLPCPICSQHATEYLKNQNFDKIRCREDLIQFFFDFHNVVNRRKKYATFEQSKLSMYDQANFSKIFQSFIFLYKDRVRNTNNFINNMSRYRVIDELSLWMVRNRDKFVG